MIATPQVDGILHPLRENGLPANANFQDLSERADEDLEDDGSCVFRAVAGEFEPHCMAELERAVTKTGAQVVLSSTWRETPPQRRAVDRKLQEFGIPASVDATPRLSVLRGGRAAEILAWAAEQPAGTRWVALDDIELGQPPRAGSGRSVVDGVLPPEHFIHVDPQRGLTAVDADRLIALLGPAAAASATVTPATQPVTAPARTESADPETKAPSGNSVVQGSG